MLSHVGQSRQIAQQEVPDVGQVVFPDVQLMYPDVYGLSYSPSLIHWIPVQDFDVFHGDLVWASPLQVEVLEQLGGGTTWAPVFHGPSLEGPACVSYVHAAASLTILSPTPHNQSYIYCTNLLLLQRFHHDIEQLPHGVCGFEVSLHHMHLDHMAQSSSEYSLMYGRAT